MKRTTMLLAAIFVVSLILTACTTSEATQAPVVPTNTEVFIPTVTPQPTATPEPTEPPVDDTTPEYIVGEWLMEPNTIWAENAQAMAENQGGQFGPGSNKNYNAEEGVFAFTDSESIIWTRLNTNLDEWGGAESHGNQAILIKWQAYPPSGMTFTFIGMDTGKEFSIQFHGPCHLARTEGIEEFSGNIAMGEGIWFYTLMAMDKDGNFRSVIWQAEDPYNRSSYFASFGEEYANDSWRFILGSTAPMTLNLAEYQVLTFAGFAQ